MWVTCNEAAVAYFKVLSRYLSWNDSEKSRKYAVNRVFVPLKNQTAHFRMQFVSDSISFDFPWRFSIIIHHVNVGWIKLVQDMIQRRTFMNIQNQSTERICWKNRRMSWSKCTSRRLRLKCDGTRAETRFRLSAKRTVPFKSVGASVQSTTGSRDVRISGSNAGYTMFRGSVKSPGYPLHSPVSPSLPLPYVTVCHHISPGLYHELSSKRNVSRISVII